MSDTKHTAAESRFWDAIFQTESDSLRKKNGRRSVPSRMNLAASYADIALEARRRSDNSKRRDA